MLDLRVAETEDTRTHRYTIFSECRYSNASVICAAYKRAVSLGNECTRRRCEKSSPPGTYSNSMYRRRSSCK